MITHKALNIKDPFGSLQGFQEASRSRRMLEEGPMFYPVKILNPKGKVKKIITPKSLSQRYWGDFFNPNIKPLNNKYKMKSRESQKKTKTEEEQLLELQETFFSED